MPEPCNDAEQADIGGVPALQEVWPKEQCASSGPDFQLWTKQLWTSSGPNRLGAWAGVMAQ